MAAKKEAKTRARARGKAQREAEREVRAKARQKTIRYAADGTRIGDDGLPMTKARTRLHNLYNACFIVMCVSFIGAAVCIGLSYFQGQRLSEWELIAYGGNQFNGLSIATLLRIEALYLLFVTAISLFANMKGMAWLYDKASIKPVKATMGAMGGCIRRLFHRCAFCSGRSRACFCGYGCDFHSYDAVCCRCRFRKRNFATS